MHFFFCANYLSNSPITEEIGPDRLIVNGNEFTETTILLLLQLFLMNAAFCSRLFHPKRTGKYRRHEHFNNNDNKYPTLILYRINNTNESSFIKMAVNCILFDIQNCISQIFICLLTSSLFINRNTLFLCSERQNKKKTCI